MDKHLIPLFIALGFSILLLIFNIVLIMGCVSLFISLAMVALLFLLLHRQIIPFSKLVEARSRDLRYAVFSDGLSKLAFIFLAITLMFGLIGLLAPSTGYDSNVYRITLPKLYALHGSHVHRPDIFGSQFPQVLLGIHAAAYQFAGEDGVEILNMVGALLFVIALLELACIAGVEKKFIPISVLLACGTIQFMIGIYDADNEIWMAFVFAAMFTYCFIAVNHKEMIVFIPLGLLSAFLLGIKLNATPGVAILIFYFIYQRIQNNLKNIGAQSIVALFISSGYLLFLYWLDSRSAVKGAGFLGIIAGLISMDSFAPANLYLALKPILIFNPIFLIYLFMIPLSIKNRICLKVLALFIFVSIGILLTNPYIESYQRYTYYLSSTTTLSILITMGDIFKANLKFKHHIISAIMSCVLACAILSLASNAYRNAQKIKVAAGIENADAYISKRVCTYAAIKEANRLLKDNGKLLLIAERSQWLDIPFVVGVRNRKIDFKTMNADSFIDFMRSNGFTHILYTDEPVEKVQDFLDFSSKTRCFDAPSHFKQVFEEKWVDGDIVRHSYIYEMNVREK